MESCCAPDEECSRSWQQLRSRDPGACRGCKTAPIDIPAMRPFGSISVQLKTNPGQNLFKRALPAEPTPGRPCPTVSFRKNPPLNPLPGGDFICCTRQCLLRIILHSPLLGRETNETQPQHEGVGSRRQRRTTPGRACSTVPIRKNPPLNPIPGGDLTLTPAGEYAGFPDRSPPWRAGMRGAAGA